MCFAPTATGLAGRFPPKPLRPRLEKGAPYQPFVLEDGNLVTGQNPASSGPLADAVNRRLAGRA
ncbi:hypothetical protein [Streptomyces sp. S.PB5]|uniref:hypothetical protein n=1 Tax=Streptomyces sp. S.PB5 TaxID=3020844 RepID=UPI0025B1BE5D|nr:hypothetical protein [Streptomyces sp. S.PB5]MDN3029402.1 hypothetical protein [Streptomyces sp. S.PB5]